MHVWVWKYTHHGDASNGTSERVAYSLTRKNEHLREPLTGPVQEHRPSAPLSSSPGNVATADAWKANCGIGGI